jgi:uncharacterized membrane protein YagU involved in acid resistance
MQTATWRQIVGRRSDVSAADLLKGLGAGLVGGLVGTVAMTQFQTWATKAGQWLSRTELGKASSGNGHQSQQEESEAYEPATAKTATAISTTVFRRQLTARQKEIAGTAVHYGFGTTMGGVYGAVSEVFPAATTCSGTLFGSTLWLLADEVAIPALRLGSSPLKTPASVHLYALASHLVYGLTTDVVRRAVRARL